MYAIRVCRRCASIVVVTRISMANRRRGRRARTVGRSLCLVYARFMCTPHHLVTVSPFCVRVPTPFSLPLAPLSRRPTSPLRWPPPLHPRCTASDLSAPTTQPLPYARLDCVAPRRRAPRFRCCSHGSPQPSLHFSLVPSLLASTPPGTFPAVERVRFYRSNWNLFTRRRKIVFFLLKRIVDEGNIAGA